MPLNLSDMGGMGGGSAGAGPLSSSADSHQVFGSFDNPQPSSSDNMLTVVALAAGVLIVLFMLKN